MLARRDLKLLVVAHDDLVGQEIARVLRTLGHSDVVQVSSGVEAVAQTCALCPCLVIMDMRLPARAGLDAARRNVRVESEGSECSPRLS